MLAKSEKAKKKRSFTKKEESPKTAFFNNIVNLHDFSALNEDYRQSLR